jgi:hypothetical protein
MKAKLPSPAHYSHQLHRKQRLTQIILPMAISVLVLVGVSVLISLATFQSDGDVSRWAAVSTIWIVIPVLLAGLILLGILSGLIYLLARTLRVLPRYTSLAQNYAFIAQSYIVRAADGVVKPVIALEGFIKNIKAFFERMGTL